MADAAAATPANKRDAVRRSWLYVPLHEQKFVDKARGIDCDVVILDLQDGVPGALKDAARARLASAVALLRPTHPDIFVRLNQGAMRWADLDACIAGKADQVLVAMADDIGEVRKIGERLRASPVGTRVPEMALSLESAHAILTARELAACDPSVSTIIASTEDLAWELNVEPGPALRFAKLHVVLAAAEAGVFAAGVLGHLRAFTDPGANEEMAREAFRYGFLGCSCIHPNQVAAFNRGFTPTNEDVAKARALVDAYDAKTSSAGAVGIEGEMADGPVVGRARSLLADYARKSARDETRARKQPQPA
jgi:citrate lyase subunit beta/citryl-CoA lyase